MSDYIFVADNRNARLVKRLLPGMSYDSEVSAGDVYGATSDGTYIYTADYSECKIYKWLISDLSAVTNIGSFGTGNDQFDGPAGILYSKGHIYVADSLNGRVVKRLASDLSYVSQVSLYNDPSSFGAPVALATDGIYLYVSDYDDAALSPRASAKIVKLTLSDLSFISEVTRINSWQFASSKGIYCDGTHLYVADCVAPRIVRLLPSNLSFVDEVGTKATADITAVPTILTGSFFGTQTSGTFSFGDTLTFDSSGATAEFLTGDGVIVPFRFDWISGTPVYTDTAVVGPSGTATISSTIDLVVEIPYENKSGTFSLADPAPETLYVVTDNDPNKIMFAQDVSDTGSVLTCNFFCVIGDTAARFGVFPAAGSTLTQYNAGATNTKFNHPGGIVTDDSYVYFTDSWNNRIIKLAKSDLSYVGQIGTTGVGNNNFDGPLGIGISSFYDGLPAGPRYPFPSFMG